MGIAKGSFSLLCNLKRDYPNFGRGSLLQLGRQSTYLTAPQLIEITRKFDLDQLPQCALPTEDRKAKVGDVFFVQIPRV